MNHSVLRIGSRGNEVKTLQSQLNSLGYNAGAVDGIFGNGTAQALKRFQQANGLSVDGIAGNNTWSVLASKLAGPSSSKSLLPSINKIINTSAILPLRKSRSTSLDKVRQVLSNPKNKIKIYSGIGAITLLVVGMYMFGGNETPKRIAE